MAQRCEQCGKGPTTGHNVSHSMRHTKRRFMPNLFQKKVLNLKTGLTKKMKICAQCLRTSSKVK